MALIEQRHPAFSGLMRLWREAGGADGLPLASELMPRALADQASMIVTLALDAASATFFIAGSGSAVDQLYGATLVGHPAADLSPARTDAEHEAHAAAATGRPLLIEDELRDPDRRRRIARLYLPLANDDGTPDGVLCSVVAVS